MELIYAMYTGASSSGTSRTLEAFLESKYGPQKVSLVTRKAPKQGEAFRKRRIERGPSSKRGKVLLMDREKMSQSCGKRILPDWHLSQPALEEIRKEN